MADMHDTVNMIGVAIHSRGHHLMVSSKVLCGHTMHDHLSAAQRYSVNRLGAVPVLAVKLQPLRHGKGTISCFPVARYRH